MSLSKEFWAAFHIAGKALMCVDPNPGVSLIVVLGSVCVCVCVCVCVMTPVCVCVSLD